MKALANGYNKMPENKKILLISPYAHGLEDKIAYPPLGLLYMASNMTSRYQPDIYIMESPEFDKYDYQLYGISVHSVGVVKFVRELMKKIHINNPSAFILVGGAAVNLIPQTGYNLRLPGEGEKYFDVDVSSLDNIRYPARYLLDKKYIRHEGSVHHATEPSTTMIATRGCPYTCGFCDRATMGQKFRVRSIDNISREIMMIQKMYGINWIRFVDDCITLNKKWFAELCLELWHLGVKWTCLSRADSLDKKIVKLMKKCGCQEIFFGFETGSQYLLDKMNKYTTVEKNIEAIKLCRDVGITSCAYMMFGFPGEDGSTVDETIEFLKKAKPDKARLSQFIPIPGSPVWEDPARYNVKIKENYEDFWYFDNREFALKYGYITDTNMKMCRSRLIHYFEDAGYSHNWTKEKVA